MSTKRNKLAKPKRAGNKLLSITAIGNSNKMIQEQKCCDCHPKDTFCSKIQIEQELESVKQNVGILNQEINQLRELNKQLINKLHEYEENETSVLDKHLEYDRIQDGFQKICQNFSDVNDPSLGNLSVRGATKKMLLNLQQFAYEQIAGLKINYNFRLESIKESFAEEIEDLQEALALSAKSVSDIKVQNLTFESLKEEKEDNSARIIEELEVNSKAETERANLATEKFQTAEKDLAEIKAKFEDLLVKFDKLKEKCDREIDIKMDFKERLEEIENKYQNISISSLHAKIASLKSQLDLQRLEDAK